MSVDYIKAVFSGQVDAQNVWNIGFYWTGPANAPDMNAVATDMLSKFNSDFWAPASFPWKANLSSNTGLSSVKAFRYVAGALADEGQASQTPVTGTNSTTSPGYTACCVTLTTSGFGKSKRGRVYLPHTGPCLSTGQMNIVPGHTANLATFLRRTTFTGLGSDTITAQVYSRHLQQLNGIYRVRMDTRPDTQRGRIGKMTPTNVYTTTI